MAASSGFPPGLPPNSVWGSSFGDPNERVASTALAPNSIWPTPLTSSQSVSGASSDLLIPLDDVAKVKKIAIGAFGTVYEGRWQHTCVAIKKLNGDLPEEEQAAFEKETAIMQRLRHPHVVQLYGVTKNPNSLIMEYMAGGTLYDRLKSSAPLDWRLREQIALDITKGLAYLHSIPLFHRDLKSNNVLLDDHLRAKIADFGLSQIKLFSTCTARYGHFRWAAPELLSEAVSGFNAQCDIYSLGMVFWEIASRKIPFADLSDTQVISRIVIKKEHGKLPEETSALLRSVIHQTWDFEPSNRARLDQVVEELEKGLALLPRSTPSSSSSSSSIQPVLDLSPLFVPVPSIAFGPLEWEIYFGCVKTAPPLPVDIEAILNTACPFWPEKKVKETHLLVLIPDEVDGQPYTFNLLAELIQKHKGNGHATRLIDSYGIKKQVGTQTVSSHWILMTKDPLRTVGGEYEEQCQSLERLSKDQLPLSPNVPTLLEAATSILVHYVRTGERIYHNDPPRDTRCQEQAIDSRHALLQTAIGCFRLDGLPFYCTRIGEIVNMGCCWKL